MKILKQKRIFAALTAALLLFNQTALASVLGTDISSIKTELAQGTALYTNTFKDPTVGKQTERYVEYVPNADVTPILTNGWTVYGKRTLTAANDVLRQLGYNSAMGINADFFSFQTGVPMSNTIIDGKVVTKDSSWMWGIGFRADGTAFTAKFPISTTASLDDGSYFTIECINKYRQPYALYLFTEDFGDKTHSPGKGTDIILGSVSGNIRLGESVTAVVEDVSENDGSVQIPSGKMVLSVSSDASDDIKARIASLSVGQKITLTTNAAESAELWQTAKYAVGCMGGKLISNGKLDFEDESAAPRTAIGIKSDGSVIFYTIDGRQSGYSYGVRKETLARRLLELGCIEAINLDGGGSTTMGATLPGTTSFKVISSPSEGGQRSCANFFFLLKLIEPTGIPYALILDNYGTKLLSGASINVSVISAYDTSYGPANIPDGIEYYVEDDANTPEGTGLTTSITPNGLLTVHGNGDVYVAATNGQASGSTMVSSITTPDSISVFNADNGYQIQELVMEPGSSVSLSAESYWYGEKLVSDSSCYRWTIVNDGISVGTIEQNGVFHAADVSGATGKLVINAGLCVSEIPIVIREGGSFAASENYPIIDGYVREGKLSAAISNQTVSKENIHVTVDAKPVDFDYNPDRQLVTYRLSASDSFCRIGIFVTADNNTSAMRFFNWGRDGADSNGFSDTENHWAKSYISYLAREGVVNGSLEGDNLILFKPDRNMTRTEFAIMLCNYLHINAADYADTPLPFTDNADIPWWAENNIKAIYSLGIMKGQLNEYGVAFNPTANINRMEFAISLSRLLPDGLEANPITATDSADIPFWAEEGMRVICTQGIMTGYPDGTLLPLRNVTRAEASKMLYNVFGTYVYAK